MKKSETHSKNIPLQPASLDIWDKKYRLKNKKGLAVDKNIDDTFRRVAKELAGVEKTPEKQKEWEDKFLWALRNGATPAGRIMSNAGALEYKPATSAINCTVSAHIRDSMDNIMERLHEAALTLKAGCGIGYEFSTLRPRNAFVAGAGANTSGPLSFMDIYDKMCFTVSSAGGRRGAQMGTFSVSHPDVKDFIRAKREDGRLRQFNLSLLINEDFMDAVKKDGEWVLYFPLNKSEEDMVDIDDASQVVWRDWPIHENYIVNSEGLVACKVYEVIKARRLWDMIMSSTYDFAEPGFVLIDKSNEMNNNWWCENIRATNPCVTADTRLHTQYGLVKAGDLFESQADILATVDKRALETGTEGVEVRSAVPMFRTAKRAKVYKITTQAGYEIKASSWHEFYTGRGKIKLKDLKLGDTLWIQSGKGQFGQEGSEDLGLILGFITGDGHITANGAQPAAHMTFWGEDRQFAQMMSDKVNKITSNQSKNNRNYITSPVAVPSRNLLDVQSKVLARLLNEDYKFNASNKLRVPEVIFKGKEECVKGYLRALFQCDGTVQRDDKKAYCTIRLASSEEPLLKDIQILLSNFGIFSSVLLRRKAGKRMMPDGRGGQKLYDCRNDYELIISSQSRDLFMSEIGFICDKKNNKYKEWKDKFKGMNKPLHFTTKIRAIEYVGQEAVYDTTQQDKNNLIFNGLVTGNCGEQNLPEYGSCLLGSVNLTHFVKNPFTKDAAFDWASYKEVVRIFTRMLDNVVEINGLPLPEQRHEIEHKRRHGMGYLGLGSTLTMLRMPYGSEPSLEFTEEVTKTLAMEGWRVSLELSQEKGPAPIMEEEFTVNGEMLRKRPEMKRDGYQVGQKIKGKILHAKYSKYMQRIAQEDPELVKLLSEHGSRFTHHSSIAPTGTISLSFGNNASNGIEPSFAHHYSRNVIREGKKSKEKVDVYSFELLAYRGLVNENAMPYSTKPEEQLPEYFVSADDISPKNHVDVQAVAQLWIDSSISKTANVPTDYPFEDFKDIYMYAYEKGLKGCTTFRFNPEAFQGVLVKEKDLEGTTYVFTLDDGSQVELKGNEEVEYDGEMHTAANLFDALKEGYYGKF